VCSTGTGKGSKKKILADMWPWTLRGTVLRNAPHKEKYWDF